MPRSGGIRLPAEWELQSGVMIIWPHEGTDWASRLTSVYPVFAAIGTAIATHETLLSVCCSAEHLLTVRTLLRHHGARENNLSFRIADSNDSWARDYGPLSTLVDGEPQLQDFIFNGWGGKFEHTHDAAMSSQLHAQNTFPAARMQRRDLVLEGGAIETDGAGTLLATRTSIITASRNPSLSAQAIEQRLNAWLGFERFLWLDYGAIGGDDTDGHIDTIARFADPATILYATAPTDDDDHTGLAAMVTQLEGFRTHEGQPYRLLPLPFPGLHRGRDGRRLPASYANFLIINQAVLLPIYGVPQDNAAREVVQYAFPGRQVIAVDCRELIQQNGSLHCLTMQFPRQIKLLDGTETTAA